MRTKRQLVDNCSVERPDRAGHHARSDLTDGQWVRHRPTAVVGSHDTLVTVLLFGAIYLRKVASLARGRNCFHNRPGFGRDLQQWAAIALSSHAMPIPGLFGI